MDIKRAGSQPSGKRPGDWCTGSVRIDPFHSPQGPARVGMAFVTFEPSARKAWHTHPLGQTLIVTAGRGWVQRGDGSVQTIRPSDVVWFPPGEKHRHGATTITAMRDHLSQDKTGPLSDPLPATDRQQDFAAGTLGLWRSGDLVIYYRSGRAPSPGIIMLGHVSGEVSIFDRPGPVTVRLERAQ